MIKINLLHSVTERHAGAVATVDQKIGSPATRLALMTIAVFFLAACVVGWDVISTGMAKAQAEKDLAEQQQMKNFSGFTWNANPRLVPVPAA